MCETVEGAQAHALALLLRGYSPEEVEDALAPYVTEPTSLSDPANVLLQEVSDDAGA